MWVYAHCLFSVFSLSQLCASCRHNVPQIKTYLYGFYPEVAKVAKWRDIIYSFVFFPVFDPCTVVFCLLCLHQSFSFLVFCCSHSLKLLASSSLKSFALHPAALEAEDSDSQFVTVFPSRKITYG